MSYHILFWMLCAVIAANILVVAIAITRAYRKERGFGTLCSGRTSVRSGGRAPWLLGEASATSVMKK